MEPLCTTFPVVAEWRLDTLKIACVYGASETFEWLVDHVPRTPKRVKEDRKKLKTQLKYYG